VAVIDEKSYIYYDITPKIVPAGHISRIVIQPVAVLPFDTYSEYIVCISGMEHGQENKSVVVNKMTHKDAMAYGDFRLVRYALYLTRQVFPLHDDYCYEEGRLMLRFLAGDQEAASLLGMMKGRTARLYNRIFGNER